MIPAGTMSAAAGGWFSPDGAAAAAGLWAQNRKYQTGVFDCDDFAARARADILRASVGEVGIMEITWTSA